MKNKCKDKFNFFIIFSLIILIFLIIKVIILKDTSIDLNVYNLLKSIYRSTFTNDLMIFISFLGSAPFLIALSVLILIWTKKKKIGITVTLNLAIVTFLNNILKLIFLRERPIDYGIIDISGYSFPSGHSMVSAAYYGYLIYLICTFNKNKSHNYILTSVLLTLILLIGFSRLYFGVHYLSDVIGGFLFSIIYLTIFIKKVHIKTQK